MLSHEDIQQISAVIREQLTPMTEGVGGVEERLSGMENRLVEVVQRIDARERLLSGQIATLDHKLDAVREDVAAILTTVIEHHSALEQRVTRIEERLQS